MGSNLISELPVSWAGLPNNLYELRINNNQLTWIPTTWNGLPSSFNALYLSDNQIASIPSSWEWMNDSLYSLYLDRNNLTTLPSSRSGISNSLWNLSLYENQITTIPDSWIWFGPSLRNLRLRNNQISSIPSSWSGLPASLQDIRLNNNQITTIPDSRSWLLSATSLRQLHLENNLIWNMPDSRTGLPSSLKYLYLYENKITSFPNSWVWVPVSLRHLRVYDNFIGWNQEIPYDTSHIDALTDNWWLRLDRNCFDASIVISPLLDFLELKDWGYVWNTNQNRCDVDLNITNHDSSVLTPTLGDTMKFQIDYYNTNQVAAKTSESTTLEYQVSNGLTVDLSSNPGRSDLWGNTYQYDLGDIPYDNGGTIYFTATVKNDLVQGFVITNTGILDGQVIRDTNLTNNTSTRSNPLSGWIIGELKIYEYIQWYRQDIIDNLWENVLVPIWQAHPLVIEFDNQSNTNYYDQEVEFLGKWNIGDVMSWTNVQKTIYVKPFVDRPWLWNVQE